MHRITVLIVLFLLLFGSTVVALAQDPTLEPPVSAAEPPENVVEKPLDNPLAIPLALFERLGYWLVIGTLAYLLVNSHKSIRDMIPVESARAFYNDARAGATAITEQIPGKIDDLIKDLVFNRLKEALESLKSSPPLPPTETPAAEPPRTFIQENAAA